MLPKPPFIPPKPGWLPKRDRMTIALGMLASDGVVIAADREEGDGYLKTDIGKISHVFRGLNPIGSIAVAGAGEGPAIDEISTLLSDIFCTDKERNGGEIKEELTNAHRTYYKETVLPFAIQHQSERPDYALVIGCLAGCGKIVRSQQFLGWFESFGNFRASES
jgi:hypothetical protein